MAGKPTSQETQERLTYVSLIGLFTSLFGAVVLGKRRNLESYSVTPTDLALLSLATYRAGRLAAYDRVTEPLRAPITETVPDEYEAGENVVAEGAGVQKALGELVSVAKSGKTQPADMAGGTFTITNVGVFGVDAGTPIINPGESAILCFGAINKRPWVDEVTGEIVARDVSTLALSFDHRHIDGELGSRFLADVAAIMQDPAAALLF